jgi:imidazolonepropionase-like amidohydrolase
MQLDKSDTTRMSKHFKVQFIKKIVMKKIFISITLLTAMFVSRAQDNVYPASAQTQTIALTNATIHIGNGQVIENGTIVFSNGKIVEVGTSANTSGAKVIDCKGKHIYPGLIECESDLGLNEISSTRSTQDARELGELNPNVRSIVAYNSDSKVIGTLRSNGILLANVVPEGGIISGSSSVVQLDAWNWEDAAYKMDQGIHFRMPSLSNRRGRGGFQFAFQGQQTDPLRSALDRIDAVRSFLREARAYYEEPKHTAVNLKFEAVKGLFDKSQTFYVHAENVKEILIATDFAKEFGFKTVIVGGNDAWRVADYLKDNNIAVVLNEMHLEPLTADDDIDQPYKNPSILQNAGVLYSIADTHGETRGRNLMFNAGVAAGYGLTKEQALQAITLNAAKILGIDDKTGSLEKGKDANIIVSDGDILDPKSSTVTNAFIQGRTVNLDDKGKQLYERYKYKYGIK